MFLINRPCCLLCREGFESVERTIAYHLRRSCGCRCKGFRALEGRFAGFCGEGSLVDSSGFRARPR